MDASKYNRSVVLLCPTCGGTQFEAMSVDDVESPLQKCATCDREITRDELIRENSENIEVNLEEVKKQVTEDVTKEVRERLSKAFKGSKFFKIK